MTTAILVVAIWAAIGFTIAGFYAFVMVRYNTRNDSERLSHERL